MRVRCGRRFVMETIWHIGFNDAMKIMYNNTYYRHKYLIQKVLYILFINYRVRVILQCLALYRVDGWWNGSRSQVKSDHKHYKTLFWNYLWHRLLFSIPIPSAVLVIYFHSTNPNTHMNTFGLNMQSIYIHIPFSQQINARSKPTVYRTSAWHLMTNAQ